LEVVLPDMGMGGIGILTGGATVTVSATGDDNVAKSRSAAAVFVPEYSYLHVHQRGEADTADVAVEKRNGSDLGTFSDRFWPGEDNAYRFRTEVTPDWLEDAPLSESLYVYRIPDASEVAWLDTDVACDD